MLLPVDICWCAQDLFHESMVGALCRESCDRAYMKAVALLVSTPVGFCGLEGRKKCFIWDLLCCCSASLGSMMLIFEGACIVVLAQQRGEAGADRAVALLVWWVSTRVEFCQLSPTTFPASTCAQADMNKKDEHQQSLLTVLDSLVASPRVAPTRFEPRKCKKIPTQRPLLKTPNMVILHFTRVPIDAPKVRRLNANCVVNSQSLMRRFWEPSGRDSILR